ncbi:MAG: RelE_StbE domain-containing protein [uncultured Sulfurovum sp.]|uniref:RelE_StbE domain-containing protein n=1 Tax=uncultured Sulfurovum sp. TaxID=269237 RepID=A0A6S6TK29_9BACT|nr:MAG: RelE_StbE domain-containing protein [uncultured Sulfurovum sp.]
MLKVKRHKTFVKELRNAKLSDQHFSKYIVYLSKLIETKPLPEEALDHALKGEYQDCREFHVSGDLLVIYFIVDDTLNLVRIGSHSQLFK